MIIEGYILTKIALVGWYVINYVTVVCGRTYSLYNSFKVLRVHTLREI